VKRPSQYQEGFPFCADFTTTSNPGGFSLRSQEVCPEGTWICSIIIRADDSNTAAIKVGGEGSALMTLQAGEFVAIDVPPNVVMDLAKFAVDGLGTSGNIAHFIAIRIQPQ
jgi:hypothetical protein